MRVLSLKKNDRIYTSSVYLVLGDWNHLDDVNTLVDIGTDGYILQELEGLAAGVGKRKVERVVVTHHHFDHVGGMSRIIERYQPEVWAFHPWQPYIRTLHDGQHLRLGDRDFYVIHTPGHSTDSVCLYDPADQVLFSGDTPLNIMTPGGSYSVEFVRSLEKLARLPIKTIFPGHDQPITHGAQEMIRTTLRHVYDSHIMLHVSGTIA